MKKNRTFIRKNVPQRISFSDDELDNFNCRKLVEIIGHFLELSKVYEADMMISQGGEGEESVDVYISFTGNKKHKKHKKSLATFFSNGIFIEGEFWHIINRAFSIGKPSSLAFWDFTLKKAEITDEEMRSLSRMPIYDYSTP